MKIENKKGIWVFWVLRVVGEGAKGFMVYQIVYGTEPLRQRLIFIELIVVTFFDFALFLYLITVSCLLLKNFGSGLKTVIHKRLEAGKRPFI
jgi:hypothetical protein